MIKADVFGSVGLGWRGGIQTLVIQLRERGKIMRCLTEEHWVQSIRKCVEVEEGGRAGYETE